MHFFHHSWHSMGQKMLILFISLQLATRMLTNVCSFIFLTLKFTYPDLFCFILVSLHKIVLFITLKHNLNNIENIEHKIMTELLNCEIGSDYLQLAILSKFLIKFVAHKPVIYILRPTGLFSSIDKWVLLATMYKFIMTKEISKTTYCILVLF